MKPLDRLLSARHLVALTPEDALGFVAHESPGILLIPGDPVRPEVTDVAVVVDELGAMFPSLRLGIAALGEESAYRTSLQIASFPALVFVRDGKIAARLARMHAWTSYANAARAVMEGT